MTEPKLEFLKFEAGEEEGWRRLVDPGDPNGVLNEILKAADIRQALILRPVLSNRTALLRGIIQCMKDYWTSPDLRGISATI